MDDTRRKDTIISIFMSTFEPLFDPEKQKEYLPCEYYRVGKSYRYSNDIPSYTYSYIRSPLSNKYYPTVEDTLRFPTEAMKKMEVALNSYLQGYFKHYYTNGMGTAYAFEMETIGQYNIIILTSNSKVKVNIVDTAGIELGEDYPITTKWNISHHFIVTKEDKGKEKYRYGLKSNCTAYIRMGRKIVSEHVVHLFKELSEKGTMKHETVEGHVKNIGKLMEKMEGIIRKEIEFIHLKKVYDTVKEVSKENEEREENKKKQREELIKEISHLRLTKNAGI